MVGFTSAHYEDPGAAVTARTVRSAVAPDDDLGYAVIKFDPAKVTGPSADFDGFVINGIGPDTPGRRGPAK